MSDSPRHAKHGDYADAARPASELAADFQTVRRAITTPSLILTVERLAALARIEARVADLEEMLRAAREAATTQYEEARAAEAQVAALTQERDEALGKWSDALAGERNAEKWLREAKARAQAAEAALANTRQALADLLENGGWGHGHWDPTGSHGAGCPVCVQQREARDKARRALAAGDNTTESVGESPIAQLRKHVPIKVECPHCQGPLDWRA